jgi:hypothetical protein
MAQLILGIDPGELLNGAAIIDANVGPRATASLLWGSRISTDKLGELIEKLAPKNAIVCYELYRVFAHKLEAHKFSRVQTIESIGVIEYLVKKYNLKCYSAMSANHKPSSSPITTKYMKLANMWGNYPEPHAGHIRDAIRVALYQWKIKGILNNGKLVVTAEDREILGLPKLP